MIRLLILLITLNAVFPVAGFASACVSDSSESSMIMGNMQHVTDHDSAVSNGEMVMQSHCDDPSMACYDANMTDIMQSMDCDSGCCANCVGASAAMTALPLIALPHLISIKPVSGYINFYTRSISPELQPPLV